MANLDPQQEIVQRLVRLYAIPATNGTVQNSVQFLRARCIPDRQVHAVTFKNQSGQSVHFICFLLQDEQGQWRFRGGAGGEVDSDLQKAHLVHQQPWAYLSGGGWPDHFYAGGYVINKGLTIARVRLITANNATIEDTVDEHGLVLFLSNQRIETPLQAELYDQAGKLVHSHDVF